MQKAIDRAGREDLESAIIYSLLRGVGYLAVIGFFILAAFIVGAFFWAGLTGHI